MIWIDEKFYVIDKTKQKRGTLKAKIVLAFGHELRAAYDSHHTFDLCEGVLDSSTIGDRLCSVVFVLGVLAADTVGHIWTGGKPPISLNT